MMSVSRPYYAMLADPDPACLTPGVISAEHAALSAPRGRAARALRRGKLPGSARCGGRRAGDCRASAEPRRSAGAGRETTYTETRDTAGWAAVQLNAIGGVGHYTDSLVINTGTSVHVLVHLCDLST